MRSRSITVMWLMPFLAALTCGLSVSLVTGVDRPMTSDAHYFLELGRNLAAGHGYVAYDSFWPGAPTMGRSPGWPFAVSIVLRLFPGLSPDGVMRALNVLLNGIVACLVVVAAYKAFGDRKVAVLAGCIYALNPGAYYYAANGDAEILFLVLALGGLLLLMKGGVARYVGAAVMGASCLVRAYFILWIGFAVVILVLHEWGTKGRFRPRAFGAVTLAVALFLASPLLWAMRNYGLCHRFPVFSTLRGEVFYGGNNARVAGELEYWGYWVFPNAISGEVPKADLAATRSEYQLDEYYFAKGKTFLKENRSSMPRMVLGKLVRAYVPVPWKPNWGSYGVSAYRWLLYAAAAIGLCRWWRRASFEYLAVGAAVALTDLATVVVFWGCARFAFIIEPFLAPLAAVGALDVLRICRKTCRREWCHGGRAVAESSSAEG